MSQPEESIPLDPELNAIEAALGSLAPSKSRLDRDRLMFLAGQRQQQRQTARWPWRAIAATLALVALGEGALLAFRPESEPRIVERLVVVQEPALPERSEPVRPPMPEPEGPAPVVILSQSSKRPDRSSVFASSWPSDSSYMQLRRNVLRYGIEGLPEPPPLVMLSIGEGYVEPPRRPLRFEVDQFLNPGESS